VNEAYIFQDLDIIQLPEAGCGFEDFTLPPLLPSSPQAARSMLLAISTSRLI
jgi:hypothetical protein